MRVTKLLVVDDDPSIVRLVQSSLGKDGDFEIRSAQDPIQGLSQARSFMPDLIVLDIGMPGGGGVQFFHRIRALVGTNQIPILVFSARDKSKIEKEIAPGPLQQFLSKPATPEQIKEAVSQMLSS